MMLAIRHITSLPKVIRAIGKIEKIVDMILRRPRESRHADQTAILLEMKRVQYRKDMMRIAIADRVRHGFKIESQSDFQAVLTKGHMVWKQRQLVEIDEWGEIHEEALR